MIPYDSFSMKKASSTRNIRATHTPRRQTRRLALALLALVIASFALLAQGPGQEVVFSREIPTQASIEDLDLAMRAVINWPQWIFSLKDAQVVDIAGKPLPAAQQEARLGSRIRLWIEPKKREWKRYQLLTEVTAYEPLKRISLRVLEDSTGKLTAAFSSLEWTVELLPGKVLGVSRGTPAHWRSRLFSRLAPHILMYQAFYPDLLTLATIKQPLPLNPPAEVLERLAKQRAALASEQQYSPY